MSTTLSMKNLLLLLPALLVGMTYGIWLSLTRLVEAAALQRNLTATEKAAPAPNKILETRMQVNQLELQCKQLEATVGAEKQRWESLASQCTTAAERNHRREKLTHLLTRSGLSVLEDGPNESDKSNKEVKPCASLEALARQIGDPSSGRHPLLWRLHLYGSYANLRRALEELTEGDVLAIPVALSMTEAKTGGGREWFLLVWI